MRIGLIAIGSLGDVMPYVALGKELSRRGHEVVFVTHTPYIPLASSHGLSTLALDGDPQVIIQTDAGQAWIGSGENPLRLARNLMPVVGPFMHKYVMDCWAACENVDAVVVSWMGFYVASSVAEKLGLPLTCAFLAPISATRAFPCAYMPTPFLIDSALFNRGTHWLYQAASGRLVRDTLNQIRHDVLGLGPVRRIARESPVLYGYSPSVLPRPADWGPEIEVTGYWFLDTIPGWLPEDRLASFLDSGPPPVYVGFGSMVERDRDQILEIVCDAVADAGCRAVVVGADASAPRVLDRRGDVLLSGPVPHGWLFPRVSVAVHHGGAGTTAAAFRAGLPMVTVPFFADQVFWGRVVNAIGAAPPPIPRRHLTSRRLAEAIVAATAGATMRARSRRLAQNITQEQGVNLAISALERAVGGAQPGAALAGSQ